MSKRNTLFLSTVSLVAVSSFYLFTSAINSAQASDKAPAAAESAEPAPVAKGKGAKSEPQVNKRKRQVRAYRQRRFIKTWVGMNEEERKQYLIDHPEAKAPTQEEIDAFKAKQEGTASKKKPAK